MTRPSLNQLAPTRTDNTLDRTFAVFYDGNADLQPVEADQADLSAEWYFADKSVLSGAVFWKDISGFITTELEENVDIGVVGSIGGAPPAPILYDVSRPINGDKAKVWGLELGVQHFFSNGFGVRANYTFTDTKAYVDGVHVGDLEGVSESAYSVALMFENDRWDAQVAADYSGEYLEVADAVGGTVADGGSDHLGHGVRRSTRSTTRSRSRSKAAICSTSTTSRLSGAPTCWPASKRAGPASRHSVTPG